MADWNPRAREVFVEVLKLNGSASRQAVLDRLCAGDDRLRVEVEAMLRAHDHAGEYLDQIPPPPGQCPTVPNGASAAPPPAPLEFPGMVIAGKYKLLQKIGEGGMGSVWMADQTEPVKRRVAVKLIRAERDGSRLILSRFEAERQAIALMDHPNIAKLLDAGTIPPSPPQEKAGLTEASPLAERGRTGASPLQERGGLRGGGTPFFVMELVKGIPLNEYCDQHKLSVTDRLKLFIQICSAVQHAHQKGIIHRDLKPSNILVVQPPDPPLNKGGAGGVPKVIDFGLAKALSGQPLTEHTLFTAFGAFAGTPLYMAPEQARFNAIDVDTRADVYALGVILYELLTGSTPIERGMLKEAALDEVLRVIRESEPPTPSRRLSALSTEPRASASGPLPDGRVSDTALLSVAANRQMEPEKLSRFLRGDLDWIVMKALAKERDRRYETANGFARDVERFLNNEPVVAGPPSASYKLRKFVQRNRGRVLAAALVFLALLLGMAGTTFGLLRAEVRRAEAEEARAAAAELAESERLAKAQALKRLEQIEKGNEILTAIFTDLDPRAEASGGPPLRAALGDRLLKASEQLEGEAVGDPLAVANLQNRLGQSLFNLGMHEQALKAFEKSWVTQKAILGADHHHTLATLNNLALSYQAVGKLEQALPLLEESFQLLRSSLGPDHSSTLVAMNNLATGYLNSGKPDQALPLLEESLILLKANFGDDNPQVLTSMNNLAMAYHAAKKHALALPLFEETYRRLKESKGAEHPDTLMSMNNLAGEYDAVGKHDQAVQLHEECLRITKARLGAEHPDALTSMNNLALSYLKVGKNDQALPLFEEALRLLRARLGNDHPNTLLCMSNLATGYHAAGKLDQALPLFEESAVGMERRRFQHQYAEKIVSNVIDYHERVKDFGHAESWRRKWLEVVKERSGADSPLYAKELVELGQNLLQQERWTEAETTLRECLASREKRAPDAWTTFNAMSLLGAALASQHKFAEAEPLLLKGYEGMNARAEKIPPKVKEQRLNEARERLVELYQAMGKPEEAARWRKS